MKSLLKFYFAILLITAAILPCFSQNYYSGDGGSNIRLAVYEPQPQGNISQEQITYIQSMLNNNFNRFSSIRLIDQQYLDRIVAEQDAAASGRFSDEDYIRIGALVNAQYLLFGTVQNLSANRYRLNLSITDASEGMRIATFMKEGTLAALVYEATEALLNDLGVRLTSEGKKEFQRQQRAALQAERNLAREAARAEKNNNTATGLKAAMEKYADFAERSFLGADIFYQVGPNKLNGVGLDVEGFIPILPFVSIGGSGKFGLLPDGDKEFDKDDFFLSGSFIAGVVWPFNPSIKAFGDIFLDFGKFGPLKGIFADWFTLSYDLGLQYNIPKLNYVLGFKYRGSFYKDVYTSAVSLGVSMWWDHK